MSVDTYGLSTEQYEEFFVNNVTFAAKLYLATCNIMSAQGVGSVDFKTALEMYNDAIYVTNDDCRRYQKSNNPDALKQNDDIYSLGPTREELMAEIQAVNTKVEKLLGLLAKHPVS